MRVGQSPATHLIDGFSQFFGINGFEQVVEAVIFKSLDCIFIIGSGEDDWGWYGRLTQYVKT